MLALSMYDTSCVQERLLHRAETNDTAIAAISHTIVGNGGEMNQKYNYPQDLEIEDEKEA